MDLKNDTAVGEGIRRSLEFHNAIGVREDAFGFKESLNLHGNDHCRGVTKKSARHLLPNEIRIAIRIP